METKIQNNNQQNTNKRNIVEFFILPPVFAQIVVVKKILLNQIAEIVWCLNFIKSSSSATVHLDQSSKDLDLGEDWWA